MLADLLQGPSVAGMLHARLRFPTDCKESLRWARHATNKHLSASKPKSSGTWYGRQRRNICRGYLAQVFPAPYDKTWNKKHPTFTLDSVNKHKPDRDKDGEEKTVKRAKK